MSKSAKVVIGANFGDEGKGLFTDYFASQADEPATVVRFNGGAQAGHTVELADGTRHIFSHFGSGTFAGAKTWLSRFFVANPLMFMREWAELIEKGAIPRVAIDAAAPVTTPFDMMINQIVEDARGNHRHGSCGVGFGETLARQEESLCPLTVDDLRSPDLREKLLHIRAQWVPVRLQQLGVYTLASAWQSRLESDDLIDAYIHNAEQMLDRVTIADSDYLRRCSSIIFEGAQGLLLDQNHKWFPHVTRSNTGLQNVVQLAEQAGLEKLDVLYATRAYLTRHGAGPLPFEIREKPYPRIFDATNKPHPYQGNLRFAPLNFDLLQQSIHTDLEFAYNRIQVEVNLGVSCVDQLDETAHYICNHCHRTAAPNAMLDHLMTHLKLDHVWVSKGPTRATIEKLPLYAGLFHAI